MKKFSAAINSWVEAITVCFLVVMLGLVAAQIITRYLLNSPPAWLDEAARYCMVWTALLGATIGFYRGLDPKLMSRHVFRNRTINAIAGAGRPVAVAGFFLPLIYFSFGFLSRHAHRTTESLGLNSALVVSIVPICSLIVMVHLAAQTFSRSQLPVEEPGAGF